MRRKPAILLFALLLLLPLGGAILFHQLRKEPRPTFTEVDAFLKNHAASGDWKYLTHSSKPPYPRPRPGWWDYLFIHRSDVIQEDEYTFLDFLGEEVAIAVVGRKEGTVQYLYLQTLQVNGGKTPGSSKVGILEKSIYGRFPAASLKR